MRVVFVLCFVFLLCSCRSIVLPSCTEGTNDGGIETSNLIRRVRIDDVARETKLALEVDTVTGEARDALVEWVDQQAEDLRSQIQPGDELWLYRMEKCCGWYREGYALIRGHCLVADFNIREDM